MDAGTLVMVIVIVGGALSAIFGIVPKLAKYKFIVDGGKAMAESLVASKSATDDTPGVITPAEWAEAFEIGAGAARKALKDS